MNPQQPWVMGSRVPPGIPLHLLIDVDQETAWAIDRAAAVEGVDRIEFLRRVIDGAVRSILATDLPAGSAG